MKTLYAALTLFMAVIALPSFAPDALAGDVTVGEITIKAPWARASTGGKRPSAAYMTITNAGNADILLGASTPRAGKVEIHQTRMENGVMKMTKVTPLSIPGRGMIHMKPGGYHVMMMQLKQPLKNGEHFPLNLTFKNAGDVHLMIPVKKAAAMNEGHHGAHGGGAMKDETHEHHTSH